MMVIRPARDQDVEGLFSCAMKSSLGFLHLPKNKELLSKEVSNSKEALMKKVASPIDEIYLFVLTDTKTGEIGGTCNIYAQTGFDYPFHVYSVHTLPAPSQNLPIGKERRLLQLKAYQNGPSEIGGLYILPESRHFGLGKLLSLSRFLFIAAHPSRFSSTILANIRGVIQNNISPFWNGFGRHFLDVSFEEVTQMRIDHPELLTTIFPPHPIYVTFLSEETRSLIEKEHSHSTPAVKILQEQGFSLIGEIDPFDGGPILTAETKTIKAIKESRKGIVHAFAETEGKLHLLSNDRIDFRACLGTIQESENKITLSKEVADALEVTIGDTITRFAL